MVDKLFGLNRRAFPATPDPTCYYAATGHEKALNRLLRTLEDGEGVVLLTGPAGTGKTLLCHCLLDRLGPSVASAFLTNGHVGSAAGLLQALLFDLSLPHEGRSTQEMRLTLTDHLLRSYAAGKRTVLLLDEAQCLGTEELEEVRQLGNLEGRVGKAVQVVLAGQPGLRDVLARPALASLRQRVALRAQLEPLELQEAADYVLHHLRVAGGRPEQIIDDEALEILARGSHGIPRLLNQAAHQALLVAGEAGADRVDVEVVLEALSSLGLPGDIPPGGPDGLERVVFADAIEGPEQGAVGAAGGPPGQESREGCRLFVAPGQSA